MLLGVRVAEHACSYYYCVTNRALYRGCDHTHMAIGTLACFDEHSVTTTALNALLRLSSTAMCIPKQGGNHGHSAKGKHGT